jgi:hypothetical protein
VAGLAQLGQVYLDGQSHFKSFSKAPTQTTASGIWFDLSMSAGNPVAQYYIGAAYAATALARSADHGLNHGPDAPAGFSKYLSKLDIATATLAASVNTFELLDYLLFYPFIAMDAGVAEMVNVTTLPRYTDGRGVQIMAVETNSYVGSATFQVTYTNQDGVPGRVTPVLTCNTQISTGTVATSATATVGCCGRFLTLQAGDYGVRSIESIEFFTPDVGLLTLVLVKPLAYCNIFENTAANFFDLLRDFKLLPQIESDAYLNFICLPTGTLAGAQLQGNITTIWVED